MAVTEMPEVMLPAAEKRRGGALRPLEAFPVRWDGPSAVVWLPDRVDGAVADQARDALLAVINRGIDALTIDLSATVFLSRAGALAIARAQRRAVGAGVEIRIVAPRTGPARRSLEQASITASGP